MKKSILTTLVFCIFAVTASGQEGQSSEAEMMAKYMELAEPGPEHEFIAKMTGTWDLDGKMWVTPGSEPMTFQSVSNSKMVLGGRFLMSEAEGEWGGMPAQNIGFLGFDRRHEKFTTVGFDNFGTYWVTASGDYNEETKTLTMYGEDEDPIMGFVQKYNFVWDFESDDKMTFSVVFFNPEFTGGADEFKMIEIVYTRKK